MPRAPKERATTAANGDAPRRSARVKAIEDAKPPPPPPAKKRVVKKDKAETEATKKKGTKRAAEEDVADDEPAAKKVKADSEKPASKKPASKAKASAKPASKTAAKPASKGSAKPSSKTHAKPRASAAADVPDTIDEEDEDELDEDSSAPSIAALQIGDVLPDVTLKSEKDADVSIKSLADKTGVVLFLFPKADTPGCNKQACGFRDIFDEFPKLGYTVYGLSADKPAASTKWQAKNNLPYGFLSDPELKLIKALGAVGVRGNNAKRSHFVIGKGGKLLDKKIPVKPEESPTKALEFIKSLKA